MKTSHNHDLIYAVVMSIPKGRVATYGQVANIAGLPRNARQVGYALKVLSDESAIPWHRVVNSRGEISKRFAPISEKEQRILLEEEGIFFGPQGRISLTEFQWEF